MAVIDADQMGVPAREYSPELQALMQRYFVLPPAEQLRVYREIRSHLASRARETKADREEGGGA